MKFEFRHTTQFLELENFLPDYVTYITTGEVSFASNHLTFRMCRRQGGKWWNLVTERDEWSVLSSQSLRQDHGEGTLVTHSIKECNSGRIMKDKFL